jgi:hypothetical protein
MQAAPERERALETSELFIVLLGKELGTDSEPYSSSTSAGVIGVLVLRIAAGSRLSTAAKLSTTALVVALSILASTTKPLVRSPAYQPMSGCQRH